MKKIITFSLLFIMVGHFAVAQSEKVQTILFLLPMDAERINEVSINTIEDQNDITKLFSQTLIGFWEGAQIALDEFANKGQELNVIVRDITDDTNKLNSILADPKIQQEVDLIIAPVYGKIFPIIGAFAKEYKIPTVNPFSTRHQIVENNPYIYKLIPSLSVRPEILVNTFPDYNFILWANAGQNKHELSAYESYFKEHSINYQIVSDTSFIDSQLSSHKGNVIVTLFDNPSLAAKYMGKMLSITNKDFRWIVPENWFSMGSFNIENANVDHMYFFTNYFADDQEEATEVFNYNYATRFESMPSITTLAYQGYDVTHFFVELITHDYTISADTPEPLACSFKFKRIEKGGFENNDIHLIQLENYKFIKIK